MIIKKWVHFGCGTPCLIYCIWTIFVWFLLYLLYYHTSIVFFVWLFNKTFVLCGFITRVHKQGKAILAWFKIDCIDNEPQITHSIKRLFSALQKGYISNMRGISGGGFISFLFWRDKLQARIAADYTFVACRRLRRSCNAYTLIIRIFDFRPGKVSAAVYHPVGGVIDGLHYR